MRKTPLYPSAMKAGRRSRPCRQPGQSYSTRAYHHAVRAACDKAGVDPWHPNQLRHAAATRLRERFGLEAAQVVLGHSRADVTQVYAERDLTKAREVMALLG
jgi:integrase